MAGACLHVGAEVQGSVPLGVDLTLLQVSFLLLTSVISMLSLIFGVSGKSERGARKGHGC